MADEIETRAEAEAGIQAETATVPEAASTEAVEVETVAEVAAVESVPSVPSVPAEAEPLALVEPSPKPPKKKRTVRTRTLFVSALVLGIVGGVAGGYTVQAMRKPTPLPVLRVTQPVYPASAIYVGVQPPALPATSDDATIVNGDLTKLLLPTPSGATAATNDHVWMELANEASLCDNPSNCFSSDLADGMARIADTSWNRGDGFFVEIRIYQYLPGDSSSAERLYTDFTNYGRTTLKLPAGIAAAGYEYKDKNGDNDDTAVVVHGNLALYFWVTSSSKVPDPSIISDLIAQQMARL